MPYVNIGLLKHNTNCKLSWQRSARKNMKQYGRQNLFETNLLIYSTNAFNVIFKVFKNIIMLNIVILIVT